MEINGLGPPQFTPLEAPTRESRAEAKRLERQGEDQEPGELRQRIFREARRLPDKDEEIAIVELHEEKDGASLLRAVQVIVEEVPLAPVEAARAQAAGLNPARVAQLLFGDEGSGEVAQPPTTGPAPTSET